MDPNLNYNGDDDNEGAAYPQSVTESTTKNVPIQTLPSVTTGGWPVGFNWPKASSNAPQQAAASPPPETSSTARPRPKNSRPRPSHKSPGQNGPKNNSPNVNTIPPTQPVPGTKPVQRLQVDNDGTSTLDMSWALQDRSSKPEKQAANEQHGKAGCGGA